MISNFTSSNFEYMLNWYWWFFGTTKLLNLKQVPPIICYIKQAMSKRGWKPSSGSLNHTHTCMRVHTWKVKMRIYFFNFCILVSWQTWSSKRHFFAKHSHLKDRMINRKSCTSLPPHISAPFNTFSSVTSWKAFIFYEPFESGFLLIW